MAEIWHLHQSHKSTVSRRTHTHTHTATLEKKKKAKQKFTEFPNSNPQGELKNVAVLWHLHQSHKSTLSRRTHTHTHTHSKSGKKKKGETKIYCSPQLQGPRRIGIWEIKYSAGKSNERVGSRAFRSNDHKIIIIYLTYPAITRKDEDDLI